MVPLNVYTGLLGEADDRAANVVGALRPGPVPPCGLDEIRAHGQDCPGDRSPHKIGQPRIGPVGPRLRGAGPDAAVLELCTARTRPVRAMRRGRALRPLRGLAHRRQEEGWCWGGNPAAWGNSADRPAPARLRAQHPVIKLRPGRDWTVHDTGSPTGRCAGSGLPVAVWDTGWRVAAGRRRAAPDHPAMTRAAGWMPRRGKYPGPG